MASGVGSQYTVFPFVQYLTGFPVVVEVAIKG
jgi:hypothetical protein